MHLDVAMCFILLVSVKMNWSQLGTTVMMFEETSKPMHLFHLFLSEEIVAERKKINGTLGILIHGR